MYLTFLSSLACGIAIIYEYALKDFRLSKPYQMLELTQGAIIDLPIVIIFKSMGAIDRVNTDQIMSDFRELTDQLMY